MNEYQDNYEFGLIDIFQLLKRNLGFILLITIVITLFTFLLSFIWDITKPPSTSVYQAASKIEIAVHAEKSQQLQAVMDLFKGDFVIGNSINILELTEEIDAIRGNVEVRTSSKPNEIEIIVAHEDKETAQNLANNIQAQGISLAANSLHLTSIRRVENAVILKEVLTKEESVNIFLNTTIAFALGLMISIFLVFIKNALYPRITSEGDLEKCYSQKVLVTIPQTNPPRGMKRFLKII